MSDIPEPPVVPPAPSRLNPGTDLAEKADALAAFYPTLVAYIVAAIAWIADAMQQIAATVLYGTLPSLSGHALKFMRVNAAGTMAEFVAPTSMLAGTALSGLETAHGDQVLIGAGGSSPWNLAAGAQDFTNSVYWRQIPQVVNGVTLSVPTVGSDVFGRYIEYTVSGTATATADFLPYMFEMSATPAAQGNTFTLSYFAQIVGGTIPTNTATGMRCNIIESDSSNGTLTSSQSLTTRPSTRTLNTHTYTLPSATAATARGAISIRIQTGQTVNFTVRLSGLQFERGPARTNGQLREIAANEVLLMIAQRGTRLGHVDGTYTPAHSVTSGIPLDNTAPLWTEGAHLISVDYVPKKIGSKLLITATLPVVGMSVAATAIAALYVNEVVAQTARFTPTNGGYEGGITVRHILTVTSLSSIKVSLRFGPQDTGYTAYINRGLGGATMGNTVSTLLTVEEIAQ